MLKSAPISMRAWFALIVAASLLAYAASPRDPVRFMLIFATSLILFTTLFLTLIRLLSRQRLRKEADRLMEIEIAKTQALSLPEARKRARELLNNREKFKAVRAESAEGDLMQLAPALQEFFSEFKYVEEKDGDSKLDRSSIAPSTHQEGYIHIGSDMDNTEILVLPHREEIFIIHPLFRDDPQTQISFPSVYHFLAAGYSNLEIES